MSLREAGADFGLKIYARKNSEVLLGYYPWRDPRYEMGKQLQRTFDRFVWMKGALQKIAVCK